MSYLLEVDVIHFCFMFLVFPWMHVYAAIGGNFLVREGIRYPGIGVAGTCELSCGTWDSMPRFSARTASILETALRSGVLTCSGKDIATSFFPLRISVPPTGWNGKLSAWLLFSQFPFFSDALQNPAKPRIACGFMRAACPFRMAHCSIESEWPSSLDLGQG